MLERLHSRRARRSIASVLVLNLDPEYSVVGIDLKVRVGAIFAEIVADERLAGDISALARHAGIEDESIRQAITFARGDDAAVPVGTGTELASLALARAASYSPARIEASTVDACRDSGLSPAAIVEIVAWLSVLQMMHRLTCYLTAGD